MRNQMNPNRLVSKLTNMNSANEIKDSTFKSYIDETELENISLDDQLQKTTLLDGETLVHEAQKVLMYAPLSDRKKAVLGVLSVTTFKLSFASPNKDDGTNDFYLCNNLLRRNEICLSSIDTIYQIGDKSKKKLIPCQNVSAKVKELLIVCKNMRVLSFNFKHADKDQGRFVANVLLHHAFPKRHQLLFAYDFKEPYYKPIMREARFYTLEDDWRRELDRTKCPNWRVSDVNKNFDISTHLPQFLVVPKSVVNIVIKTASGYFRNGCIPTWVWGNSSAALVRMADLLPGLNDRTQESLLVANVHKSHPEQKQPIIVDLDKECPSPRDVHNSYLKLCSLCTPESVRIFKAQDFKFYGLLDGSKWYHHVSTCLTKAAEVAKHLDDNVTIILQEDKGQDMNCVISSLAQILLDAHWRTKKGFQSLVQKEWVAMGHAFANRLGHILNPDVEPSFLFLFFLDCVWQLLQQFPIAFQFTETYLTTVWDSALVTVFDTFLFNSEHDRYMATIATNPLVIRSVWDWSEQFSDNDVVLFNNPLYDKAFKSRLIPKTGMASLEIWRQCYFRWLPDLEIRNGGKPQIDLCNRFLAEELELLRRKLQSGDFNGVISKTKEDNLQVLRKVNSFYPFSYNGESITDPLQVNSELLSGDVIETQSILNLTND